LRNHILADGLRGVDAARTAQQSLAHQA